MKLSIIIVNYNVKFFLEQCLHSILASQVHFAYEIFIVDNNSTDKSIEYLQPRFQQKFIHFIANRDNLGFAKANNQAIKQASGEFILLLNPDTVLGETALSNVIHFLDQHPKSGAVGVKMINGNGKFLAESKRGFPSPWASFCKIFGLASIFPKSRLFGKYNLLYLNNNEIHQVPILAGAFMMLRRKAIDQSGLLDENFFMYGEDIDLSYRILKSGYLNYYLPETILHYKGESTDKNDEKYISAFYEAMRIFYKKYYPHSNRIFSGIISVGISLKKALSSRNQQETDINKKQKTVTFDSSKISYADIIRRIENEADNRTEFLIYSPNTQITIGSHLTQIS